MGCRMALNRLRSGKNVVFQVCNPPCFHFIGDSLCLKGGECV